MFPVLHSSTRIFGIEPASFSSNFGGLLMVFLIMALVFAVVLFTFMAFRFVQRFSLNSNEWNELNRIFHQLALTREETFFLKQTLEKSKIKHPAKIFEETEMFERMIEKPLEHAGTHKQHLVMSIRQKVFGSKKIHSETL